MTLGDDFLAARGGPLDFGGALTSIGAAIAQAQRFKLTDEVARSCGQLTHSKPSTLNAALPLCRLPHPSMWIEYRGGLGAPAAEDASRPVPLRQGVLVESCGEQTGIMTVTWVHRYDGELMPSFSPFALYFDWGGSVAELLETTHARILKQAGNHPALEIIAAGLALRGSSVSTAAL